ncbi:hypothetical protein LCGC14_0378120 [marine sediment metagenome]|uniref:Uncharacterized protein n=1 Tax=marine sediment metagenome TaxID=412755 RepID=A0A0F9T944_9ZZZZ
MSDFQREYRQDNDLIDQVCDWIAQKWSLSMIKFKLRETLDKEIKDTTVKYLIKIAKNRIVKRYHIPIEEFKGEHIAWLEAVMRGRSYSKEGLPAKMCDRLRAAENLCALLNLENVTNDDPAEQAKKIHAFLRAAEATVGQENKNDGQGDEQERESGQEPGDNQGKDDQHARHGEDGS